MADWRDEAACLDDATPGDWFASPVGDPERVARAIAVCQDCPVALECLEFELDIDERWGVWGGRTAAQRGHPGTHKGLPDTEGRERPSRPNAAGPRRRPRTGPGRRVHDLAPWLAGPSCDIVVSAKRNSARK